MIIKNYFCLQEIQELKNKHGPLDINSGKLFFNEYKYKI